MMSLSLSRSRETSGCGNSFIVLEILYLLPPSEKHKRKLKLTMSCPASRQTRRDKNRTVRLGWALGRQRCAAPYTLGLWNVYHRVIVLFSVSSHLAAGVLTGITCVIVLLLLPTLVTRTACLVMHF